MAPAKNLYVSDEDKVVWDRAEELAATRGTSLSRVAAAALAEYLPDFVGPSQARRSRQETADAVRRVLDAYVEDVDLDRLPEKVYIFDGSSGVELHEALATDDPGSQPAGTEYEIDLTAVLVGLQQLLVFVDQAFDQAQRSQQT
jgi:hypothetical protein